MKRSMPKVPGKSSPQATDRRSSQSIWDPDKKLCVITATVSNARFPPRSGWRLGCKSPNAVIAFRSGLLRNRLPTATTAYSVPGVAVHGLMTVMPAARKGASSRVATLNRRDAAMAAIWASATAIE